ncbi:ATP synthase F0 subunit B [Thermodesulforhabdus norvegica]|uniref:ATP synthase subunit b n=1 Tax=Thermodesulforhabdus norvegica TaxID=39841 RepID=A0A1I4VD19_9BACT|nr:ATP synthase F0 subunit B [Thermodesulforhabdus norvegica]SFM99062.1 F-type H+-transporting ATPase subunit b [Thermodesulforhabdus norvegica]
MISIDVTLLVQMVNFLVFLAVMNILLYRPVRRIVEKRNKLVLSQKSDIEKAQQEAEQALREFEETIRNARIMGRQKIEEYKEKARAYEKELLQKAYQEAAEQVAKVREEISREREKAIQELRDQIQVFSLEVVRKILGRSVV